jgi:hypothetical protein
MINLLMCVISALFGSDDKTQTNVVDQQEIIKDQPADSNVSQSTLKPFYHS